MSSNHFVYNPSTVDIRRSKFLVNNFWKGAIFHGDLVPIEITEILPGDSLKYDVSMFVRTATPPIAPFMDSIHFNVAAFYVPKRLVSTKVKEFYGENTEGYGVQTEILEPRSNNPLMTVTTSDAGSSKQRSLAAMLGLVRQNSSNQNNSYISLNPLRSFLLVYNEWFRNENFHAPYLWDRSQTGDGNRALCTLGGVSMYGTMDLPVVCKQLDRFTSCLPWAQKGSPVLLPLGDTAPVIGIDSNSNQVADSVSVSIEKLSSSEYNGLISLSKSGTSPRVASWGVNTSSGPTYTDVITNPNNTGITGSLYADLSAATAASVNELRLAFATQRYLEALARTGSKYREYIKGMFGVNIGDSTAQMPEYLGGMSVELNVDQVLQTTDYAAGGTTKLGAPGASSTSASSQYLFTKSFTEPGYLVVVAYTKHNRTYGQGIDEIYQKHELLEYYNPKFANIGETAIKKNNIYFTGQAADDDSRLGFQESWSDYRHKKDMIVGSMAPSNSSSFNFWSLAENFASAPVLNGDFLKEDRNNITRVLAGGVNGPDYFVDFKLKRTFVRPMPLFSIPGLIDHH